MWLYSDLLEYYEKRLKRYFIKNERFFNQATKKLCDEYKIYLALLISIDSKFEKHKTFFSFR